MWATWWIWMLGALVLAFVEVLVPAHIFLGFAVGAALTGVALAIGVPGLAESLPLTLVVFAALYFRYRRLDPRLTPSKFYDVALWTSAIAILTVAVMTLKDVIPWSLLFNSITQS